MLIGCLQNRINAVWSLLNTNFFSSLLGALVFGIIANYIFARAEERRASKEVISKLIELCVAEIEKNLKLSEFLGTLKQNQCHTTPEPFHLIALETTLRSPFFFRLSPELGAQMISVIKDFSEMNQIHNQYHQFTFGASGALTSSPELKKHLYMTVTTAMPNAKKELTKLKELLEIETAKFSSYKLP